MLNITKLLVLVGIMCAMTGGSFVVAEVEMTVQQTFNLESKPVDVAIALNGRKVFAITDQGYLLIYEPDGKLADKVFVGKGVDRIKATPREDILMIGNSREKTLKVITLDYIQKINTTGSPTKGPEDAPVEIVVFSDFQCPSCAALVPVMDRVVQKYPEQVKISFMNFPLQNHRFARPAASAALAAKNQGKFWEFHDRLFENYRVLSHQKIEEIANELGLDLEKLKNDMKDVTVAASLSRDASEAARLGIGGTPTLFINGRIVRNRSFENFQQMIDKELNKSESPKNE
jgi:protein-disulfide isomerase